MTCMCIICYTYCQNFRLLDNPETRATVEPVRQDAATVFPADLTEYCGVTLIRYKYIDRNTAALSVSSYRNRSAGPATLISLR